MNVRKQWKGVPRVSTDLLIGNGISLLGLYYSAKSNWAKDYHKIYYYQVLQCLTLAVASWFFHSYVGITSLLVCGFRNYLAATDRLNKTRMLLCLAAIVIPGVLVNNLGPIGYLVLLANILYTLGMYWVKSEMAIKINIIINLTLWIIYECVLLDIPSIVADAFGVAVAFASIIRSILNKEEQQ